MVIHGFEKHLTLRREIGLKGACLLTILFSLLQKDKKSLLAFVSLSGGEESVSKFKRTLDG